MQEDKKASKASKEIDYSAVVLGGPLYVDPRHMEPGFHYCLPTNRPGEIEYYKRLGWEVVTDESGEVRTGLDKPSVSTPIGTAVTIQSKCGVMHILMRIPDELFDKFTAFANKRNKEQLAALGHVDDIPNSLQYGKITFSDKK